MGKLFLFEWKKWVIRRLLLFALVLGMGLLSFGVCQLAVNTQAFMRANEVMQQRMASENAFRQLKVADARLEQNPNDAAAKAYQARLEKEAQKESDYFQALYNADREAILRCRLQRAAEQLGKGADLRTAPQTAYYQYVWDRGFTYLWPDDEVQGVNFLLRQYGSYLWTFFVPLLASLLAAINLSAEGDDGTIKLLLQQPQARWHHIAAKYAAGQLLALPLLLVGIATAFLAGTIQGGVGDWQYPVQVAAGTPGSFAIAKGVQVCAAGTLLLQCLPPLLGEWLFFGAFGMLVSVLCGRSVAAVAVAFLTVMLPTLFQAVLHMVPALVYIPFFLPAFGAQMAVGNGPIAPLAACGLYVAGAVVCLALAILVFRKRDVTV